MHMVVFKSIVKTMWTEVVTEYCGIAKGDLYTDLLIF